MNARWTVPATRAAPAILTIRLLAHRRTALPLPAVSKESAMRTKGTADRAHHCIAARAPG